MGRTYSLNGYLNAVLRRSSVTLLVEGVVDKAVMHRLSAERANSLVRPLIIDHAALFEDEGLYGLGAKQKVLRVYAEAAQLATEHPRLRGMFACLVDREWDGLTLDPVQLAESWNPPEQHENQYVTLGHSIENYYFTPACLLGYLRFAFSEHYSSVLEESVRLGFPGVLALAGAYSFVAHAQGSMGRLEGLIRWEHIEHQFTDFKLALPFIEAARGRQVENPEDFLRDVNCLVEEWRGLSSKAQAQWILHGHLGAEVLWAAVGYLARQAGLPPETAEQVARGFRAERGRYWMEWLANSSPEKYFPLYGAISWLLGGDDLKKDMQAE